MERWGDGVGSAGTEAPRDFASAGEPFRVPRFWVWSDPA